MRDYKKLHEKIQAKITLDSPMPEGWKMLKDGPFVKLASEGHFQVAQVFDGVEVEMGETFYIQGDWRWTHPACIEWFATVLGIPLDEPSDLAVAVQKYLDVRKAFVENTDMIEEVNLDAVVAKMEAEQEMKDALDRLPAKESQS